jgi:hypothetical protein
MDALTGIWRLIDAKAWDEAGNPLPAPYGAHPTGQLAFTSEGRVLTAICNGDAAVAPGTNRGYSSYGGPYRLESGTLTVDVDMASDPSRIGGQQVREARLDGDRMILRPPARSYGGGAVQQRELTWLRVWRP